MEWWLKLSTWGKTVFTTIAALGATIAALNGPLEPLTPSWRGWVRQYVSDALSEQLKPLSMQLSVANESALENRIITLQLNASQLRGEYTDLTLRLKDSPGDPIINRRLNEVTAAIAQIEAARQDAQCQLEVSKGTKAGC